GLCSRFFLLDGFFVRAFALTFFGAGSAARASPSPCSMQADAATAAMTRREKRRPPRGVMFLSASEHTLMQLAIHVPARAALAFRKEGASTEKDWQISRFGPGSPNHQNGTFQAGCPAKAGRTDRRPIPSVVQAASRAGRRRPRGSRVRDRGET